MRARVAILLLPCLWGCAEGQRTTTTHTGQANRLIGDLLLGRCKRLNDATRIDCQPTLAQPEFHACLADHVEKVRQCTEDVSANLELRWARARASGEPALFCDMSAKATIRRCAKGPTRQSGTPACRNGAQEVYAQDLRNPPVAWPKP